jgi:NitT/TauT family transport system permease protein
MIKPLPSYSKKRYLQPSVFWSIRQGFPSWLRVLLTVTALVVPLLLWALLSSLGWVPAMFLPKPSAVISAGIRMFAEENLLQDIIASCGRVGAGFLAAAAVGIPVGIAMGTFPSMESLFSPLVGPVRYMPVAAFIPLIYNAIMIADAVKFIPGELLNVAYTLGATRRDVLFRVILPAVFPSVLDTLRVNIAGAWNFLVISELIAAENGLGFKIVQAQRFLQTDKVLFSIAVIGVIGWAIDWGFKVLSKILTPWAEG